MPTAITKSATSTNSPTRNSVQVSCLRCAILRPLLFRALQTTLPSHQESLQIWILHRFQLLRSPFEKYFSISPHRNTRAQVSVRPIPSPFRPVPHYPTRDRVKTT